MIYYYLKLIQTPYIMKPCFLQDSPPKQLNDSDSLMEQLKSEKEAVEEELRSLKKQNETSSEIAGKVCLFTLLPLEDKFI